MTRESVLRKKGRVRMGKCYVFTRCIGLFCAICCSMIGFSGVYDDAKFVLDVRGDLDGSGTVSGTEIGNAISYRASSTTVSAFTPIFSPGAKEDPSIKQTLETELANPYWCEDTRPQKYLYLPQTSWKDGGTGNMMCDSAVLRFDGAATLSDAVTVHARFRWDGPVAASTQGDYQVLVRNAESWVSSDLVYGWTLGVRSKSADGVANTCWLSANVGGTMSSAELLLDKGKWYDAFVVIRKVGENSTTVTVNVIAPRVASGGKYSKPEIWTVKSTIAKPLVYDSSKRNLLVGSYSASTTGATKVDRNGETSGRLFRGGISKLSIWERELSKLEMREVSCGFHGAMWSLGFANSSANEFGADDYSAVVSRKAEPVKEVFRPADDPIRLMRGKLTASNPKLTLRGSLMPSEVGIAKALVINPLLTDVGDECPVRVTLNGSEVGTVDLRKDNGLLIKKAFWQRDANGEVELAIERTGSLEGAVEIDSMVVGGAFQIGLDNKSTSEMTSETYAPQEFFVGETNVQNHARRAAIVAPSAGETNLFYYVDIPARLAEDCDFVYTTRLLIDKSNPQWGNYDFALQLNGETIWQNPGVVNEEVVTVDIPHGSFTSGLNELRWVMQTPSGGSWWWINYDFHRLAIRRDRKTAKGLALIVR